MLFASFFLLCFHSIQQTYFTVFVSFVLRFFFSLFHSLRFFSFSRHLFRHPPPGIFVLSIITRALNEILRGILNFLAAFQKRRQRFFFFFFFSFKYIDYRESLRVLHVWYVMYFFLLLLPRVTMCI